MAKGLVTCIIVHSMFIVHAVEFVPDDMIDDRIFPGEAMVFLRHMLFSLAFMIRPLLYISCLHVSLMYNALMHARFYSAKQPLPPPDFAS
jgi:hypothetical protein